MQVKYSQVWEALQYAVVRCSCVSGCRERTWEAVTCFWVRGEGLNCEVAMEGKRRNTCEWNLAVVSLGLGD